jgi:outer membrane protein assembly factor BamE (lipoprotein component of BamABCDE complex)
MMVASEKIKQRMRLASALPVLLAASERSRFPAATTCRRPVDRGNLQAGLRDRRTDAALVPPGSSREQVLLTLGTPTTTETFDNEVFYYISQTRKRRGVAFMKAKLIDQRILAVYFDEDGTVERIANYGLQDGRVFDFISARRRPAASDQTFLAQILSGTILMPTAESIAQEVIR